MNNINLTYKADVIIDDIFIVNNKYEHIINIIFASNIPKIWKTRVSKKYIHIYINEIKYDYEVKMFDKYYILCITNFDLSIKNEEIIKITMKKNDKIIFFNNIEVFNKNIIDINENGKYYVTYSDKIDENIYEKIINNGLYTDIIVYTKNIQNNKDHIQYIYFNGDLNILEYYTMLSFGEKYKSVELDFKNINKKYNKNDNLYVPKCFCIDDIPIIYDIFIRDNSLYLIGVNIMNTVQTLKNINIRSLELYIDDENIHCDKIKDKSIIIYQTNIEKYMNNELNIKLKVDIYEKKFIIKKTDYKFSNTKILTTLFKDENHLLEPWIDHYMKFGFNRFVIYNNGIDTSYYDYLINKYGNQILFVEWEYQYFYDETKMSAQITQQNHALYLFKDAYWIGMFDLDEYMISFDDELLEMSEKKWSNVSSLSIQSIWYGCGKTNITKNDIVNDNKIFLKNMLYRSNKSCGSFIQQKCIINPNNVKLFNIHSPTEYNKSIIYVNSDVIRLNHYYTLSTKKRQCEHELHDVVYDNIILKYL